MRESKVASEIHKETPASEDLLSWCINITNEIYGLNVADLTTSWKNGMAFCALIHNFRPDLIDYYKLNPEDSKTNLKTAFDAIRRLGIPNIMNSEDLMILDIPDKLSVMTILHQIRAYFMRKERKGRGLMWDCDDMFDDFDSDGESSSLFASIDQQLMDWPSKKVNNLAPLVPLTSQFLLDGDNRVKTNEHLKLLEKINQPPNQSSRLSIDSSKSGEQLNGLSPAIKPGSDKKQNTFSQSSRSINLKSESFESSKLNTQSSNDTPQKGKKQLMTRKQLMNPFDSDSDEEKKPKGKLSHRRESNLSEFLNGSPNDILDLATNLNETTDSLTGVTLSSPTSDPSSATSSSTTPSTSTTPSMSTSSSSYSNNLSDTSSKACHSINPEPIRRPEIVELAPGLLDVSPKKISPFQRARAMPAYRSLRLDSKRQTNPDRREQLHERARQLIEETRQKKLANKEAQDAATDEERRRQLREKAKKLLSDQISKMIKEKSPIEPRNMEEAIRDLTLNESKKTLTSTFRQNKKMPSKFQSNNESNNPKSPNKSYVDMELMILEKEQSKINKEAAIIEEKLRLIMKNGGNSALEEERCIRKWFILVNKKNEILRRQMKLNILEQEKDLERCYKILIKKLQPLNSLQDEDKCSKDPDYSRISLVLLCFSLSMCLKAFTLSLELSNVLKVTCYFAINNY
ncbi:EH domain-binding protein 1 isoform X2 [Tetranychus urticae]|uniref:EH domain-binding protein 1 isoform X2 n=1 Tax=Tetranychus urticae TaxID=32264 RepID=UPI00077B950A|nr:EH domain-binding protein 1 isoform X2 [Tetranychus urticae]